MNDVQPGQQLGPYRIISQIGQGGMATVYKAYHPAMDRYVAVKVLPKEFASSPEFMSRFQQEARTIANLEHPHILPVHDFGESGGIHYFVMRFLDTGTLKERIRSGPLSMPEIDRLFTQLADALGYAHERGVIHRDIKPSNVLVNTRGDVFLTDFGIAKLMEGAAQLTATGAVTGTPAYMSPEQAQGEKLDQRSDIYSLGIVLYEMITGRVPFEAETPLAVILKQMQAPLPLPSELKPGVSPDIERVLLKALAKDRNDRFATCKEFLNAWKHALTAPAPAPAAKPPPPRNPQPISNRPRLRANRRFLPWRSLAEQRCLWCVVCAPEYLPFGARLKNKTPPQARRPSARPPRPAKLSCPPPNRRRLPRWWSLFRERVGGHRGRRATFSSASSRSTETSSLTDPAVSPCGIDSRATSSIDSPPAAAARGGSTPPKAIGRSSASKPATCQPIICTAWRATPMAISILPPKARG
ncbi:MAG: serine/threonine protein kinase [Chloroflexi bacterium]|nr:serine/threonine protein kinase [Chloroflexota bacterium]